MLLAIECFVRSIFLGTNHITTCMINFTVFLNNLLILKFLLSLLNFFISSGVTAPVEFASFASWFTFTPILCISKNVSKVSRICVYDDSINSHLAKIGSHICCFGQENFLTNHLFLFSGYKKLNWDISGSVSYVNLHSEDRAFNLDYAVLHLGHGCRRMKTSRLLNTKMSGEV